MVFMTAERDYLHDSKAIADTIQYMRIQSFYNETTYIAYNIYIKSHGCIYSRIMRLLG